MSPKTIIEKKTKFFDEVIIGGGLAGLMYGITRLESGAKIAIIEQFASAGGYATSFFRNKRKYIFDCSQHKITGLSKHGNLRNAFERLDLWNELDFKYFDELCVVVVGGKSYEIPPTLDQAKSYLLEHFNDQTEGIKKLFNDIETIGYQNYMFARMLLGEYQLDRYLLPESRQLQKLTTKAYFKTLFSNNDLIELLGSIAIYLGTIANEGNALYFLHYLYAAFATNPGYVLGTGKNLSKILLQTFKNRGGYASFNDMVDNITITDTNCISEIHSTKHHILTDKITATCSPNALMKMLPESSEKEKFSQKLNTLELGWGHFCVYLVTELPPEQLGLTKSEYLMVNEGGDDLSDQQFNSQERFDILTLSVTNYHLLDPECGHVVQLIVLDHADDWFTLSEEAYLKKKEKIQQKIIERTLRYFPKLNSQIIYKESSTPRTNYKYTKAPGGSAFGYKVLPNENVRFLNNPPVKGLKFVGGWSTGPGYETAMCLGFTHGKIQNNTIKHATE